MVMYLPGLMPEQRDQLLLNLGVARGLMDRSTAERIQRMALEQNRRAADLLIQQGVLSRQAIGDLMAGLATNEGPLQVGDYRIIRQIGRGGMATIYLAKKVPRVAESRTESQVEPGANEVAIKLMHPSVAAHTEEVSRFLRETTMLANLRHPHVIAVHGYGRHGTQPYLVLEMATGGDAGQLANNTLGGCIDEKMALRLVADGCAGLSALHAARLLHRDIKPTNLLIDAQGRGKLGDFGLARTQDDADRLTATGLMVGTPAYMSPEQASGDRELDVRSDIYALGATLFALVTGQAPFSGKSMVIVAAKVLTNSFPDPALIRPTLSPLTCSIIRRATSRKPADRYPTPEVLHAALLSAIR
jgi:serine/threonine protein kinase